MDKKSNLMSNVKKHHDYKDYVTSRMIERKMEDDIFIPVIVKREDSICAHPGDVLERAINDGYRLHQRKKISLFLSALSAGFFLGFSILCISLVSQISFDFSGPIASKLIIAFFYPVGFILCVMSGLALFTEQTALAFYPFLAKKINYIKLITLWSVTILGNLVGAFIIALLLKVCEPVIGIENNLISLSVKMNSYENINLFYSSIMAGVLMAHGSWLIKTTSSAIGQIFYIYLVTFIIGLGGFHHSIAGGVKLIYLLMSEPNLFNFYIGFKFLIVCLGGNLVGGVLFIGIFNYWQIKHSQRIKV